jgi:hypothetical protein
VHVEPGTFRALPAREGGQAIVGPQVNDVQV